jgi:Flp pilus assembly protein TadG
MRTLLFRRASGEAGATLVEFALVSIVAFLLMFTMAELAMVVLGNSAGSNAARDGARVGLIYYRDADVSSSTNNTKIVSAVQKHLASNVTNISDDVNCLQGETLAQLTACNPTYVDLTRGDLIEVVATWDHKGFGPFMPTLSRSAAARMVISGEPDLTVVTTTTTVAAGPVPVSMSDITNGATDGKPEEFDAWRVTFSEPLDPTWTSPSTVDVVFTRGSSPSDTTFVQIPNFAAGSFDTGGKYNATGTTVTFSGSTITASGTNLTVTLGSCNTGCPSTIADKGEFIYTPSASVRDSSGNVPAGTLSSGNNYKLF